MSNKKHSIYNNLYKEKEIIVRECSGQNSEVILVKNIQEQKFYIAKKVKLLDLDEKQKIRAFQELNLLKQFKHPNIVSYKESFLKKSYMTIIMEYAEEGDLSYHIKLKKENNEKFGENLIRNWFIQMVFAIDYIHSKRVLHRDIKTSNIFLSSCGSIKIGDFSISKQLNGTGTMNLAQTMAGTPYYLSPEVCENQPYTYQSDMWALGCVLYELCCLEHPFKSQSIFNLVSKIVNEEPPQLPQSYSKELRNLYLSLMQKKPEKRPNTFQILSSDFVKKTIASFIESKGRINDKLFDNIILPIKKYNIHKQKEEKIKQQGQQSQQSVLANAGKKSLQQVKPHTTPDIHKMTEKEKRIQQKMQEIQQEFINLSPKKQEPKIEVKIDEKRIQQKMQQIQQEFKLKASNLEQKVEQQISQPKDSIQLLQTFNSVYAETDISNQTAQSIMLQSAVSDKGTGSKQNLQASNTSFDYSLTSDSNFMEEIKKNMEFIQKSKVAQQKIKESQVQQSLLMQDLQDQSRELSQSCELEFTKTFTQTMLTIQKKGLSDTKQTFNFDLLDDEQDFLSSFNYTKTYTNTLAQGLKSNNKFTEQSSYKSNNKVCMNNTEIFTSNNQLNALSQTQQKQENNELDLLEVRDDEDDGVFNNESDFQYSDDETDPFKERITSDNKLKELDKVLGLYKTLIDNISMIQSEDNLSHSQYLNMPLIKEVSGEFSVSGKSQ